MHWNPDDFSEYSESAQETDYADPSYYQHDASKTPRSAQPVQQLKSYSDYVHGPTVVNSYDPALMPEYYESTGASRADDYATGVGQEEPTAGGKSDTGTNKRKGLAGLGAMGSALAALLLTFSSLGC